MVRREDPTGMSFERHPVNQLNAAGAPDFVTIEARRLLDDAKAHFEAETGRTLYPSQVEMYLLETIAYMLSVRGAQEQLAFENCFVAYARSQWLDTHGADRNTPRLEATPATTTLRFSTDGPANVRIRIPDGTRVADAAGQVQFMTRTIAFIEAGQEQVDVRAEATEPGAQANGFPEGSLTAIIDPVAGVSAVTNLTETGGGAEREGNDRYRARLALAFERIGDGLSRERYVTDVLGWNARCIDVAVIRPRPGHVNIYPLMDTGAPNAEELASLLAIFNTSNTHQGDYIRTFAPTAREFEVDLTLTLSDPDAAQPVRAAVQQVLDGWARRLGGYVAPSELIRVAKANTGVVEVDIENLDLTPVAETAWRKGTIGDIAEELV